MKKIFLAACALIALRAEAQLDYVVTMKGDTLQGVAKIYTYDVIDRVQVAGGKEKGSFTAVQVKEVSMRGEIYHPVRTEAGYLLMKLTKPGFISIYMAHQPKGYSYDTPWVVKRGGQALEVPNLGFKKQMVDFLVECNVVREKIKSGQLSRRDLDRIVEEFNECTDKLSKQQATAVAVVVVPPERLAPLTELQAKIEKDTTLQNQKDALDIVRDIGEKMRNGQSVPKYLTEGLKVQLQGKPEYQADIEKVLAAVNNQ